MNNRIIGNKESILRAEQAKPGDRTVLINFELINELPEEFEPVLVEVPFKFPDDFSDVGNKKYMPTPALMYKIAEAKGISSDGNSTVEPIYQDIDISEMNMSGVPDFQKIKVGYTVTKIASVMQEDGTLRFSSPCTIQYNAWDRCIEAWSKEEVYTEGYTKAGKYPSKYGNKFQRKAHFYSEMKFAQQKAETKAYTKAIRELASLMTGFDQEDLVSGAFLFVKIRRSAAVLKMETAARLHALSSGAGETYDARQLFGEQKKQISAPEPQDVAPEPVVEPVSVQAREPEREQAGPIDEQLLILFSYYRAEKLVPGDKSANVDSVIKWLEDARNDHSDERYVTRAIDLLKTIEAGVPAFALKEHNLYEKD